MNKSKWIGLLACCLWVIILCGNQGAGDSGILRELFGKCGDDVPLPKTQLELQNAAIGAPEENILLEHTGFVVSYNTSMGTPSWVAWELTQEETQGEVSRKDFGFLPDPLLKPCYQVDRRDYTRSGYDRGHMCPAGDMEWSAEAMKDCHYMSNICPQVPKLNQDYWERLESACRRWARQYGSIYIVCGPIYGSQPMPTIGTNHRVGVPDGFFKVVVCLVEGEERGIGFLYANSEKQQTMESAATTIDRVEELTGLDFFPSLPDGLETRVESQCNLGAWQ